MAAAVAQDDPRHDKPETIDTIEVHATPLSGTAEDLARPVEVLSGERLDEAKANSLGETVNKLPGVQASYFGPGVGRPIVRGLDGARVQVLSDGLGSGDVSTVSADHAVSIEPFLANQIEVLKGPATLLYGTGAIGGAVNVIDGRVPERLTDQPLEGRAELRGGSVNDEGTGMLRVDGSTERFAFHVDALHRGTGDFEIPGHAESAALMAEHGEIPDPADAGLLPNSFVRTDGAAFGLSWIGDRGFVGGAYSLFNTRYGVPGHAHEGDEAEEAGQVEDGVHIEIDQHRNEMRGGIDGLGPFESLRVKLASTEYTHTEFEGDAIGTVFDNDSTEARAELVHPAWAGWKGAFGLQWGAREFVAIGAEAFVPGSRSRDGGLFWIGERTFGEAFKLELGARHDRNRIDVDDAAVTSIGPAPDRDFDTTSASAALKWEATESMHLTLGLDRAQRSPTAEELYSNGLHVATASIEIGTPGLDVETANRAELGLHWHRGPVDISAALYQVRYDDFVYLADTGIEEHDGPVRLWTQGDARFTGAEAEVNWTIAENDTGNWDLRVFGDAVRGKLDGNGTRDVAFALTHEGENEALTATLPLDGNLPRMVPSRVGGELRWERGQWRASIGAVRYARQDDVASHETATPGYTLADAHVAWHMDTAGGNAVELFLDGSNLLDEEARPHTSFLKDLVPLPGRGFVFGVRAFF
jgi:iron complex outermembrane receptor protein